MLLAHGVHGADGGVCRAIVAVEESDLVGVQIVLVDTRVAQGFHRGAIGVLRLLGHIDALSTA